MSLMNCEEKGNPFQTDSWTWIVWLALAILRVDSGEKSLMGDEEFEAFSWRHKDPSQLSITALWDDNNHLWMLNVIMSMLKGPPNATWWRTKSERSTSETSRYHRGDVSSTKQQ